MKVAVSISDPILATAEARTKPSKLSRSRLYARPLADYVDRHIDDEITELENAEADAMARWPEDENAAFRRAASRTVLQRTEW